MLTYLFSWNTTIVERSNRMRRRSLTVGDVSAASRPSPHAHASSTSQPLHENPRRLLRRITLDTFALQVVPLWIQVSRQQTTEAALKPTTAASLSSRSRRASAVATATITSNASDITDRRNQTLKLLNAESEGRVRLAAICARAERDALGALCFESRFAPTNGSSRGGDGSILCDYKMNSQGFVEVLCDAVLRGLVEDAVVPSAKTESAAGAASPITPAGSWPIDSCARSHDENPTASLLRDQIAAELRKLFRAVDATESGWVSLDRFIEYYMDTEEDLDRWSITAATSQPPPPTDKQQPSTAHRGAKPQHQLFPEIRFFVQNVSSQMLAEAKEGLERIRRDVEKLFTERMMLERQGGGVRGFDNSSPHRAPRSHHHAADESHPSLQINRDVSLGGDVVLQLVSMQPMSIVAAVYRTGCVRYMNSDTFDINESIKPCELNINVTAMCFAHGRPLTTAVPGMNAFSSYLVACCGDLTMRIIPSRRLSTFTSHQLPEVIIAVAYDKNRRVVVGGGRSGCCLLWVVSAKGFVSALRRIDICGGRHDVLLSLIYNADPAQDLLVAGTQNGHILVVPLREDPAVLALDEEVSNFQTSGKAGAVDVDHVSARRVDIFHHSGPVQLVAYSAQLRIVVGASFGKILCFARDAPKSQPYTISEDSTQVGSAGSSSSSSAGGKAGGITVQQTHRMIFVVIDRSGGFLVGADDSGLTRMWSLNSMDQVDSYHAVFGVTSTNAAAAGGADASSSGSAVSSVAAKQKAATSQAGLDGLLCGYYCSVSNSLLLNTSTVAVLIRLQTKSSLTSGALLALPTNDVLLLCVHPANPSLVVVVTAVEVVLVNIADQRRVFSSTVGEYFLTRDFMTCALLSSSGARVILGSITGECVTARLETGRVVRRIDMPANCGAISSLAFGFGGYVEQNQVICVTSSNMVIIANDYGGDEFDVVAPTRVLRHEKWFACKMTTVPSPSHCFLVLDWGFYPHTAMWEVGGKELLAKSVVRARGRGSDETTTQHQEQIIPEGIIGEHLEAREDNVNGIDLPPAKERMMPPTDQVSCILSLHTAGLLLAVAATTSGSIAIFGLPPHPLEHRSVCSWRNRCFAYRAFKTNTQAPGFAVDKEEENERVNSPVVEAMVFIPPYTLVCVDDKDQLVLWDVSDVVLQARPVAKLDARRSTPQHPRFSTYFHRVRRPPFVKIVAWAALPRPATCVLFIKPCCLFLLDGQGIPMIFRVDEKGLTQCNSIPAAQCVMEEKVAPRARFRVRPVLTVSMLEQSAKQADGFFGKLRVPQQIQSNVAASASSQSAETRLADVRAKWRRLFHVLRITWLLQKYVIYGVTASNATPADEMLSPGRARGGNTLLGGDRSSDDSDSNEDHRPGGISAQQNAGLHVSIFSKSFTGSGLKSKANTQQSSSAREGAAATSSQQQPEQAVQQYPFISDRALVIKMDADFGAPNHRCVDLEWALDLTCAEDEISNEPSSSSEGQEEEDARGNMPTGVLSRSGSFSGTVGGMQSPRRSLAPTGQSGSFSPVESGLISGPVPGGESRIARLRRRATFRSLQTVKLRCRKEASLAHGSLRVPCANTEKGLINTTSPAEQLHGGARVARDALTLVHGDAARFAKVRKQEEQDLLELGLDDEVQDRDEGNHLVVKSVKLMKLKKNRRMSLVADKSGVVIEEDNAVFDPTVLARHLRNGPEDGEQDAVSVDVDDDDDNNENEGADIRFRQVRRLSLSEQLMSVVKRSDTLTNLHKSFKLRGTEEEPSSHEGEGGGTGSSSPLLRHNSSRRMLIPRPSSAFVLRLDSKNSGVSAEFPAPGTPVPKGGTLRGPSSGLASRVPASSQPKQPAPQPVVSSITMSAYRPSSASCSRPASTAAAGSSLQRPLGVWLLPTAAAHSTGEEDDEEDDLSAREIFEMLDQEKELRAESVTSIAHRQEKNVSRMLLPSADPHRPVPLRTGGANNAGRTSSAGTGLPPKSSAFARRFTSKR